MVGTNGSHGALKTALPAAMRPHDLLWIEAAALRLRPEDGEDTDNAQLLARAPWADADWLRDAPVVVRRDSGPAGWLPVGVRGRHRGQRCAAWLPTHAVMRCVTPAQIAAAQAWRHLPDAQHVAAVAAIPPIAARLDAAAIPWGIGGSVGFALATGQPVLRADSDLDLIVRATDAAAFAPMVEALSAVVASATVRIDVQIDTPAGGFALAEWLRTGGPVLLKTATGPRLLSDPWHTDRAAQPGAP